MQTSFYQRTGEAVTRMIGEELVLVPIRRSLANLDSIYTLNAVAAELWQRMETPQTVACLAEALTTEYEVTPAQALGDVAAFLADLSALALVEAFSCDPRRV